MISISLSNPTDGDYRCRTPLYFLECPLEGRLELIEGLVLARLSAAEADRVHAALCQEHIIKPRFRLEASVVNTGQSDMQAYDTGAAVLYWATTLLAVATTALPEWPEPVVDKYIAEAGSWCYQNNVGEAWFQYPAPKHSGGCRPQVVCCSHGDIRGIFRSIRGGECYVLDALALERWKQMVASFPAPSDERQLYFAATYLYRALTLLADDAVAAFLQASIALEALLGDAGSELALRLALRGSHLIGADGESRDLWFSRLRTAYSDRSKLVHGGSVPRTSSLLDLINFLLDAVPAFARLIILEGSRKKALAALDRCCIQRVETVTDLAAPGWWHA